MPDRDPASGETISHYRLLERVGRGSMGVVYAAEDLRLGRRVAVKILPRGALRTDVGPERFKRESWVASLLNHANICTIYDAGEHEGSPFLVMEFLEGETLKERLERGPFARDQLVRLAGQIADALSVAHEAGVVHRDIKPSNIVITPRGDAKILDFGLAKLVGGGSTSGDFRADSPTLEQLTLPGRMIGTVGYMSPEQARGKDTDSRTDLFAFGAVLYEMATGTPAFPGDTAATVIDSLFNRDPEPISARRPDLPPGLDGIVARALMKDPESRYQSASDLASDLAALERRRAPRRAQRRWRLIGRSSAAGRTRTFYRLAALAGVAVLAVLAAVAAARWLRSSGAVVAPPRQPTVAVLPLRNLDSNQDLDYLRYSVPDEIANVLARTPGISLRPSTMTRPMGDAPVDPLEIATQVAAEYLITGQYLNEGKDLRLALEAVEVAADRLLWRDSMLVAPGDLLALRSTIAARVQRGLLPALGVAVAAGDEGTRPANDQAYDLFLRSIAMADDPEPAGEAVAMLEQATQLDSGYAPVWMELARRYHVLGSYAGGGGAAYAKAIAAAQRAIDLDPQLIPAASTLVLLQTERGDVRRAHANAIAMVERRPDSSDAHFSLAYVLRYAGLLEAAQRQCDLASGLDPTNRRIRSCAIAFYLDGKSARALDFIQLDPGSRWARVHEVQVRLRQEQGARTSDLVATLPDWLFSPLLASCLNGEPAAHTQDQARLIQQRRMAESDPELMYHAAAVLARCGHTEGALELLAHAIDGGYCSYPAVDSDPLWKALRGHPTFQSLRQRGRDCQQEVAASAT